MNTKKLLLFSMIWSTLPTRSTWLLPACVNSVHEHSSTSVTRSCMSKIPPSCTKSKKKSNNSTICPKISKILSPELSPNLSRFQRNSKSVSKQIVKILSTRTPTSSPLNADSKKSSTASKPRKLSRTASKEKELSTPTVPDTSPHHLHDTLKI